MMLHVPSLLNIEQVKHFRENLKHEDLWLSGSTSAGHQAQNIKNNLQFKLDHPLYQQLSAELHHAIRSHLMIQSFALPNQILAPKFNRYEHGGHYGNHVDNAMQWCKNTEKWIRTDVSMTIFLSDPDEYHGGELIVEDAYGSHEVKLDAGDAIVYPATSLHRVQPVTQGQRLAAFTWIQSMVKDDWQRTMLFNLDMAIIQLRHKHGESEEIVQLTNHYHNLLRQWGEL